MEKVRSIKLYENYFKEFYLKQTDNVRRKINQVLKLIETQRLVPIRFLKHLQGSDGIYEIRVETGGNIYRIFCCFDEDAIIVLFHGIQKKSQKTPLKEIQRAEALKKEYFKSKENDRE